MATADTRSLVERLADLPPGERERITGGLSQKELDAISGSMWRFLAHPGQLPPPGDWFIWLYRCGRGGGKTRGGSEWVIERAREYPEYPIALVGETKADVRDTMVELGPSSILNICSEHERPEYEPSKRRLTWPNGAVASIYSGDEPDQLRGPNFGSAWIDELAKFRYPDEVIKQIELSVRIGPDPRVMITTTPRRIPIIRQLLDDPDVVDTAHSTFENRRNLSPKTLARLLARYEGTHLYRQEVLGEYIEDVEGALWTQAQIDENRMPESTIPEMERIVVGVDPPGTADTSTSKCGIIVRGKGADRDFGAAHLYTLADESLHGTPEQWGGRVVWAYHHYKADMVVAETNCGWDMVLHVLRTIDPNVPVKPVPAKRDSYLRAEPVALLAEQGRDHHIGVFPELEDQQTTFVKGDKKRNMRLDNLDAFVYASKELMEDAEPFFIVPEG